MQTKNIRSAAVNFFIVKIKGVNEMKTINMTDAIRLCKEAEALTPDDRANLRQERLKELVNYARHYSPYFKELYRNVKEDFTLTDLPMTNKTDLMMNYSGWVTDPEVCLEGVLDYIYHNENILEKYLGKYTALTTSGTTGSPMPMVRDAYHNTLHGAMMQTRLMRDVDPNIMNPTMYKTASYIVTEKNVSSYSSFLRAQKAYPGYEHNMMAVPLLDSVAKNLDKIQAFQPDMITAYPSVLGPVIKAQKEGRIQIAPKAIATSAELLTHNMYLTLRETFQCPILNNYCSTEGGEAAMSCREGYLHINDDWVIIEPVDKSGKPVKDGEWSEGILVTDLTNYVQPIIRYYMSDRIRIHTEPCACGSSFPVMEIRGRVGENITVGGKEILGLSLIYILEKVEGVFHIQLVQTGETSFEVRMIPEEESKKQEIFETFKKNAEEFFLENECGEVQIVLSSEGLIHNANGGKIKPIIVK